MIFTPEHRAKLSAAQKRRFATTSHPMKGHIASPELRARMSQIHKNPPAEARAKMSESQKRRVATQGIPFLGQRHSPESIAKMSASHRGPMSERQRERLAKWLERQGMACAICGAEVRLNLDHDHTTGRLRGALCTHCNRGLGAFLDEPDLLRQAALYLETH